MTLDQFNALSVDEAESALMRCCGSRRWARELAARRPFASAGDLHGEAAGVWAECTPTDILEALAAHPRIGDLESLAARFADTRAWAGHEQSGVEGAGFTILERLARGNRDYEERFGHRFIVCATGRSAAEMLSMLEDRLGHEAGEELKVAAAEQAAITRIRLEKLLA